MRWTLRVLGLLSIQSFFGRSRDINEVHAGRKDLCKAGGRPNLPPVCNNLCRSPTSLLSALMLARSKAYRKFARIGASSAQNYIVQDSKDFAIDWPVISFFRVSMCRCSIGAFSCTLSLRLLFLPAISGELFTGCVESLHILMHYVQYCDWSQYGIDRSRESFDRTKFGKRRLYAYAWRNWSRAGFQPVRGEKNGLQIRGPLRNLVSRRSKLG